MRVQAIHAELADRPAKRRREATSCHPPGSSDVQAFYTARRLGQQPKDRLLTLTLARRHMSLSVGGVNVCREKLADVAIYLLSLAEMTGIDLQDEIEAKMAKNAARVYRRLPNGVLARAAARPTSHPLIL